MFRAVLFDTFQGPVLSLDPEFVPYLVHFNRDYVYPPQGE